MANRSKGGKRADDTRSEVTFMQWVVFEPGRFMDFVRKMNENGIDLNGRKEIGVRKW